MYMGTFIGNLYTSNYEITIIEHRSFAFWACLVNYVRYDFQYTSLLIRIYYRVRPLKKKIHIK